MPSASMWRNVEGLNSVDNASSIVGLTVGQQRPDHAGQHDFPASCRIFSRRLLDQCAGGVKSRSAGIGGGERSWGGSVRDVRWPTDDRLARLSVARLTSWR